MGETKDTENIWNFFDTWFMSKKRKNTMEKTLHFVKNGQILVENVIVMLEDFITHVGEYPICR
jgi:hypothetical protein